jgi:hypothetical protein
MKYLARPLSLTFSFRIKFLSYSVPLWLSSFIRDVLRNMKWIGLIIDGETHKRFLENIENVSNFQIPYVQDNEHWSDNEY